MKKILQLGLLATLAGGPAMATSVSFVTTTAPFTNVASITPRPTTVSDPTPPTTFATTQSFRTITFTDTAPTPSTVTASGFYWNTLTNKWVVDNVRSNGTGVGVARSPDNNQVNGQLVEYLLLDFGTGATTASSIVLNYATSPNLDALPANSQFFTYSWLTTPIVDGTGAAGDVPLTSYTTNPTNPLTPNLYGTLYSGSVTFDLSSTGTGRYLLLGASNHDMVNGATVSNYSVRSVTYTTVPIPDGGLTVALLGASLASLGLAVRRRKE
jgi:hypothetical protein